MNKKLLNILVCPICKGQLHWEQDKKQLICYVDSIVFPIRNNIPVMLVNEAHKLEEYHDIYRK